MVKDKELLLFFTETIEEQLQGYEPGDPKNKPDVLEQIKQKDAHRNAKNMHSYIEDMQKQNQKLKMLLDEKDKQIQFIANNHNELMVKYKSLEETLKNIQEELARDAERDQHE